MGEEEMLAVDAANRMVELIEELDGHQDPGRPVLEILEEIVDSHAALGEDADTMQFPVSIGALRRLVNEAVEQALELETYRARYR